MRFRPGAPDAAVLRFDLALDADLRLLDSSMPATVASAGMFDHVAIAVADLAASERFYRTVLSVLGIGVDKPDHVQMVGENFSLSLIDDERPLTEHVHLAFPAQDDATVRAFHAAALAAGYEDHGGPGERAVYHPGYYGAFVLDPDGHNVEVVNHNR